MYCQIMKANQKQCPNEAFAVINGIPMCRLDLNWQMNKNILTNEKLDPSTTVVIDLANETELNKIIEFTNKTIDEAIKAKG